MAPFFCFQNERAILKDMDNFLRRSAPFAVAIAAVITLDRLLKEAAMGVWQARPVTLGRDWLQLTYFQNEYIAFSLPLQGWALEVLIMAITGGALWLLVRRLWTGREDYILETWGIALLFAGAASNLYDRLAYGFIVDYVSVGNFPIFNTADAAITGGAVLIGWSVWRNSTR